MEQNWYQSDNMIEVEIDCVVHAVPQPQVEGNIYKKGGSKKTVHQKFEMTFE